MFSFKNLGVVFAMTMLTFSNSIIAADKKDCVDCKYDKVVGAPSVGNFDKLLSAASKYQDNDFEGYHQAYCLKFEDVSHTYAFKKEILESMSKTPYKVEKYWMQSGCQPKKMGNTDAPILHLVAEDAAGRMQFFEALHKYYTDKKDNQTWLKIVNAKNSRGLTMLDYIVYLEKNQKFNSDEREDVNKLIRSLCDKGAVFSVSSEKKCPMSI